LRFPTGIERLGAAGGNARPSTTNASLDKYPEPFRVQASYQQAREVVPGFVNTPVNIKRTRQDLTQFWEVDVFAGAHQVERRQRRIRPSC